MKREALNHPKMMDLAARLNISLAQAIGHVTLLVNWTADFAISGDVGKWADGAIARGSGWDADATAFVTALVDSGWLDQHPKHRLTLHDWPDHAERWVRAKLAATGKTFLECYTVENAVSTTVATIVATPPRDQTKPNQTKPFTNQTKPDICPPDGELVTTENDSSVDISSEETESSEPCEPKARRNSRNREDAIATDAFSAWFAKYPRKVQRAAAQKAFGRAVQVIAQSRGIPPPEAVAWLCGVTELFASSPKGKGDFVPYPATFLNEARYDDDPREWSRTNRASGGKSQPLFGAGQAFESELPQSQPGRM